MASGFSSSAHLLQDPPESCAGSIKNGQRMWGKEDPRSAHTLWDRLALHTSVVPPDLTDTSSKINYRKFRTRRAGLSPRAAPCDTQVTPMELALLLVNTSPGIGRREDMVVCTTLRSLYLRQLRVLKSVSQSLATLPLLLLCSISSPLPSVPYGMWLCQEVGLDMLH